MPTFTDRLNSGRLPRRATCSVSYSAGPLTLEPVTSAGLCSSSLRGPRPFGASCHPSKISGSSDPARFVSSFATGTATRGCPDAGSAWALPPCNGESSNPYLLPRQSTNILEVGFFGSESEVSLPFLSSFHQKAPEVGPSGPTSPPSSHPAFAAEELLFATAIEVHP
jgi:hypothetical protein